MILTRQSDPVLVGDNTGRFFMKRLLPQVSSLADTLMAGADTLMEMDAEAF